MRVHPITMEQVDWPSWNQIRQSAGEAPATRNLDGFGVKPELPSSLVDSLYSVQHHAMREPLDHVLRLVNLGFLLICDDIKLMAQLQLFTDIPIVTSRKYDIGDTEYILKGNLVQLRQLTLVLCKVDVHPDLRRLGNQLHVTMCNGGLKDLWYKQTKKSQPDKTYTLED